MIVVWAIAGWSTLSLLIGFFILIRELLRERESRSEQQEGVHTRLDEDLLSGRKSPEECFRAIDRAKARLE